MLNPLTSTDAQYAQYVASLGREARDARRDELAYVFKKNPSSRTPSRIATMIDRVNTLAAEIRFHEAGLSFGRASAQEAIDACVEKARPLLAALPTSVLAKDTAGTLARYAMTWPPAGDPATDDLPF